MLKTKYLNKFYIKQLILNENHMFQEEVKKISEISEKDAIIGYIFYRQNNKFGSSNYILNLYLINRSQYSGEEVTTNELLKAWDIFLIVLSTESNKRKQIVFKNPPIKEWLDTKDNWCKKMANKMANQFKMSYEEMLSNVYMSIMKAYNKKFIYMGNLDYLSLCILNDMKMNLRYNRNRINQDSDRAISLDTIVVESDGHKLTIADIIPAEPDMSEDSIEYKDFKRHVINILSKDFSDREIDMILNCNKALFLPRGLYNRLLHWRHNHSVKELYE